MIFEIKENNQPNFTVDNYGVQIQNYAELFCSKAFYFVLSQYMIFILFRSLNHRPPQ